MNFYKILVWVEFHIYEMKHKSKIIILLNQWKLYDFFFKKPEYNVINNMLIDILCIHKI